MAIINPDKTYALVVSPNSKALVAAIENAGAQVLLFPPIETSPAASSKELIEYLNEVANFDWLIFSDVLAVDFCLEKLEDAATDLFNLDELRICALGEAVADRLRFVQVHTDVIPLSMQTETIFTALTGYIGEKQLTGKRFLIIKRKSADDKLKDKLTEREAVVTELEIYAAAIAEQSANVRLKALLKGGAIDEFVFSAPEDLIALKTFLQIDDIADFLSDMKISASNTVTVQALREHGFKAEHFRVK